MRKILFILLIFTSVVVFSQEKASTNPKKAPTSQVKTPTNKELQELEKQVDTLRVKLEKHESFETERLKKVVSELESELKETLNEHKTSHLWCISAVLGIIGVLIAALVALVGIGVPIMTRSSKERAVDEAIEKVGKMAADIKNLGNIARKAKTNAASAQDAATLVAQLLTNFANKVKILETKFEAAEEISKEASKDAEEAAKQSKISSLLSASNNENDDDKRIALYTEVLDIDPKYILVYFVRGFVYLTKNMEIEAIKDYSSAIKLIDNETDPTTKARYIGYVKRDAQALKRQVGKNIYPIKDAQYIKILKIMSKYID